MQKIMVIGNVGGDAELKYMEDATPVANFSVAANWKTRDGEDHTQWYRVALWGNRAEKLSQYIVKGKKLFVMGRLSLRMYTDNSGETQASLEINASDIEFMANKRDDESDETPF